MKVVHASSIGYAAQSILHANEDLLGEVHSSFRRAFNIHTYSGQIVSFSTAGTPNFPTNVVTNLTDQPGFVSLGISRGLPVCQAGATLLVGSLQIQLQLATEYYSLIKGNVPRTEGDSIDQIIHHAALAAVELTDGSGLAPLLPHIAWLCSSCAKTPIFTDVLGKRVWDGLMNMRSSTFSDSFAAAAKPLIGLGPGLTPSGDDVLAGLIAAFLLGIKSRTGVTRKMDSAFGPLLEYAATGTNRLSREMLDFAARGELTDIAEGLICSLLTANARDTTAQVRALLSYGATSGVDQLVGILFGLRLAFDV